MDIVVLRKAVEEKDSQIQNLQGVREALEEANFKVCRDCLRADEDQNNPIQFPDSQRVF